MASFIPIEKRTFEFALRIVKVCQFLEQKSPTNRVLSTQLLRSATSRGANVEEFPSRPID
ncbi:four helix bundle protein [Anaplasma marginale]|uniref:four helix bundle protein n=1 Tax=Anaplasma marginale TaxID=770 RepID=UPI0034DE76F8